MNIKPSIVESIGNITMIVLCVVIVVCLLFMPYFFITSRRIGIENYLDRGCHITGEERTRWDYIRKIPVSEIFIECPDHSSTWY